MSVERKRRTSTPPPAEESRRRDSGIRVRSDDPIDLTEEQRRDLDNLYAELRATSLYDLLGVTRLSDKKEIKRAYYASTRRYHPDRYFGKRLGSYKRKLEAIFVRMTEAHDVLCTPERRAQYDAALRKNRMSLVDAMLDEVSREMEGAEEASRREEASGVDEDIVLDVDSSPPPRVRTTRSRSE
jgi:DnaJ-class molecular chaperone